MAPATNPNVWLVADLPTATNASYNKKRATLYDDAESGEWDNIYKTLAYAQKAYNESWVNYIVSDGGWTLLHYAAYEGGPDPVNKLIKLGAWRSIKTTHTEGTPLSESEMTPYEIAKEGGHAEILAALRPRFQLKTSDAVIEELEAQLYDLICTEMEWNEDSVELPALGVLRESGADGWFPVRPGVNSEGYYYRLSGSELLLWSCDSEGDIEVQRHVSQGSYREVDEGETIYTTDPFSASTTVYTSSRGVYTSSASATSKSMSTTTTTTTKFVDNDDGTVTTIVDDDVVVRSDDDDDVILVQDPSDDDDNPGSDVVDDDGSDVPSDDPDDDPDGDPSDDPGNSDPEPDHDSSDPEPDHDGSDPEPDLVDPDDDDVPAHHQHGHSDVGGSDDD